MRGIRIWLWPLPVAVCFLFPMLRAGEPTVEEIVAKAERVAYYAGQDGRADVRMTITDAKGDTREREFTMLRLNTGAKDQKFYVYFKEPADVRKMAYLVWKYGDRDDDRWLWLPALSLVKRIAPGDERTSFVGSDFLYEDVSGRGTEEDEHELVETTESMFVVKNTPKNPQAVEFQHYLVWIDKTGFLPMRADFFDKNGKLYRRIEALKVAEIQGHPTVLESRATDFNSGGSTLNSFSKVEYDIGLQDRIFSERFLRRPPREVTQ